MLLTPKRPIFSVIALLTTIATFALTPHAAAQDVPEGKVTEHTFADSRIFPGTQRTYWLYVPAQYDGSAPACVYVNQDGRQFNAPQVFDKLIASGDMPVTVGVFVTPGVVPTQREGALPRFNRSYEYDAVNDQYARFLLEELLPHITREHNLNLSNNGKDRAIGGTSSGAIAAFTAAWERPDAFSRVFSGIGTYVGLRGGNDYPTLIRKLEPKRIRVFLQDGSNDLNIYGGDWWMANQTMQRALTFAGYEVEHAWDEGQHNGRGATAVFEDGMKFLWADWPNPVGLGAGSPNLQAVVDADAEWQLVGEGYRFTEGTTATQDGGFYFNDVVTDITYRVSPTGEVSVFLEDSIGGDGQVIGPDGRLYANATEPQQVLAWDADGNKQVIAEGFVGNDITVLNNGSMYITSPDTARPANSKVWYVSPAGEKRVVDTGITFPNGVVASPDQTLLYVTDFRSHWVYSFTIDDNGGLSNKQRFYHLHAPDLADDAGPDGLAVDTEGNLYVATRIGIQVCDQAGRVNFILPTPNGRIANLTIGGPEGNTLFAACGDKIYKRQLKVKGVQNYNPPITPPRPRL